MKLYFHLAVSLAISLASHSVVIAGEDGIRISTERLSAKVLSHLFG